jgi:6-phosphogluconolactonase
MQHGRMIRFGSEEELFLGAAERVAATLVEAIARRGRCRLVLAGGSTPRKLHGRLASSSFAGRVPWQDVEFFFGDERCVPPDDPSSNFAMAWQTLLEPLGIRESRCHRMRGEMGAQEGARQYEEVLRPGDPFDLVLLGLGADGHTASLFPGTAAVEETSRLVAPGEAPAEPRERITLTLPAINAARSIVFLVAGAEKAEMLRAVRGEPAKSRPASLVRQREGELYWLVDPLAAQAAERKGA